MLSMHSEPLKAKLSIYSCTLRFAYVSWFLGAVLTKKTAFREESYAGEDVMQEGFPNRPL